VGFLSFPKGCDYEKMREYDKQNKASRRRERQELINPRLKTDRLEKEYLNEIRQKRIEAENEKMRKEQKEREELSNYYKKEARINYLKNKYESEGF